MISHTDTGSDFLDVMPEIQPKWALNRLVPALKKPFSVTEAIKDEVRIKEHNMSKI